MSIQLSNENLLAILDRHDYEPRWRKHIRIASRAIIKDGDKYALMYINKFGEYKFPGGGVKADEGLEDALRREVREETGIILLDRSIKYYGKTLERKKGRGRHEIFEQLSYYYFASPSGEYCETSLDKYEREYGYELKWISLNEAIENNDKLYNYRRISWVNRDTLIMKKLLEKE